jgi:hypothetical protein
MAALSVLTRPLSVAPVAVVVGLEVAVVAEGKFQFLLLDISPLN